MPTLKIRSIKYNFFMNLLLTGSSVIFPLITFPLVSRALFSDMYGLCSWSFSVASWLSLIAMLGVNRYGIREVAKNRDNKEVLVRLTSEILIFTIITTIITYVCFLASIVLIPSFAEHKALFMISGLSILFNTLGVGWFFQGIEQYRYITIRGVLIKLVCLLGVIALVHTPNDYLIYATLIVLSSGIANLINFFYMLYILNNFSNDYLLENNPSHKSKRNAIYLCISKVGSFSLKKHLKPLFSFFIIAAAISIYTVLDTVMVGFLSTDQQVGYYTAAMNVKTAACGIISSLTAVLLPRASNMLAHNKLTEYKTIIKRCTYIVLAIAIPIALFLFLFATPLLDFYAGADFAAGGNVLSIVGLAVVPIGLSLIFCDAVMIPNGLEHYCTKIYIAAAVIDFVGNILLIPIMGAFGAAISTLFIEILVAVIEFILVRKIIWTSRKPH